MKSIFPFWLSVVFFVFATKPALTASELIHEEISLGVLDERLWFVSAPFMDSKVTAVHDLSKNYLLFENRGRLLSKFFLPTNYVVQGQFSLNGGCPRDQFAVFLRTDGSTDSKSGLFRNGIVAEFQMGDQIIKGVHLYEIGGLRKEANFQIDRSTICNFKIVDDGQNVILYLNDLDKPLLTLNATKRIGNKIGLLNSEGRFGGNLPNTPINAIRFDPYLDTFPISVAELHSLTISNCVDSPAPQTIPAAINFRENSQADLTSNLLLLNNLVTIGGKQCELLTIDSKGYALKYQVGDYNRQTWEQINDGDLKTLLTTAKLFDAVTAFHATKQNTILYSQNNYNSTSFEQQLGNIWSSGTSLQGRVKARMIIFEAFRKYNESRANFLAYSSEGNAWLSISKGLARNQDLAWKNFVNAEEYRQASSDYHNRQMPDRVTEQALKTVNDFNANHGSQDPDDLYQKTSAQARLAAQQTGQATTTSQKYWVLAQAAGSKMFSSIDELNSMGFSLNIKAPFLAIPNLNVAQNVLGELNVEAQK